MNPARRFAHPMLVALAAFVTITAGESGELIPFQIKDQFDRTYRDTDLRQKTIVVLGSDKEGSRFNGRWVRAIEQAIDSRELRTKIVVLQIADLRGVPFFMRGFVKKKFPKEPENRVLLDWKGRFAKSYGFDAGACNLLVFDPGGRLVHQVAVEEEDPRQLAILEEKLAVVARSRARLSP